MDEAAPSRVHDDDRASLDEPVSETGKKRQRQDVAESRKKQRRPAQRGLCELNIDELYIIFAYVYPMDLLDLARTCKYLRGLLMHKSSLFLWKAALLRVEDLPPCPADLTEPEYTNLVFYARCHGCGKPARTILWRMRRRYCPACRKKRLCSPLAYRNAVQLEWEYPSDSCKTGDESGRWVDKDQMESFVREYNQSSDKTTFLDERRKQFQAISSHARECQYWQRQNGRVHRHDLELLRKERGASIFQRLRQHGYEPEIAYVGEGSIQRAGPMFFKTHKLLTDDEWNQVWPELVEIMNNFREQRLSQTVYHPRRCSLISEYNRYVTHRPSNAPAFDLLPQVADLESCFPPFQDIIKDPKEAPNHVELFASAFSQLPVLVSEWKKQLDIEVAGLVKIPPHLSLEGTQSSQTVACSNISSAESQRVALDKLHLACAIFCTDFYCFTYPEVFLSTTRQTYPQRNEDAPKRVLSGIRMLEEAPYIVHACGLDPNVATTDDMDRRNARLKCLCCNTITDIIMDWRCAMLHTVRRHSSISPSDSPRWQLISDEYNSAIQTVEECLIEKYTNEHRRCLLCQPRVGDSWRHYQIINHLENCHGVGIGSIERGVHYEHLGIMNENIGKVRMVEEEGKVVFLKP